LNLLSAFFLWVNCFFDKALALVLLEACLPPSNGLGTVDFKLFLILAMAAGWGLGI